MGLILPRGVSKEIKIVYYKHGQLWSSDVKNNHGVEKYRTLVLEVIKEEMGFRKGLSLPCFVVE